MRLLLGSFPGLFVTKLDSSDAGKLLLASINPDGADSVKGVNGTGTSVGGSAS